MMNKTETAIRLYARQVAKAARRAREMGMPEAAERILKAGEVGVAAMRAAA